MSTQPDSTPAGPSGADGSAGSIRVVLAATDPLDVDRSRAVCDAAIEVAGLHDAELSLLYAVPPVQPVGAGTEGMAQREALRRAAPGLDAFVARAGQDGVVAHWSAFAGEPRGAIRAGVEESEADLVVVAPPRRWRPGRWLRKLRDDAGVPVLCVPPSWRRGTGLHGARILVPFFRRRAGEEAVAAALRVFSAPGADASRVTLLAPEPVGPPPGGYAPAAPSVEEALEATAQEERLSDLAGDLRRIGIQAETDRGHDGDPVEAVKRGARDAQADVIVLGTSPRWRLWSLLRRNFLGRLLGRISRPLLVP